MRTLIPILAVTALGPQLVSMRSAHAEERSMPTPPATSRPAAPTPPPPKAPVATPPKAPDTRAPSGNGKRACYDDACS
jgi:hypothetical protein